MIGLCYTKLGEYAKAREYLLLALPAALNDSHIFINQPIEILQQPGNC